MVTAAEAQEELIYNAIRMEKIIWIGGCREGFSDSDFFDDLRDLTEVGNKIEPSMKPILDAPEWAWDDEDAFLEWCYNTRINGFVIEVESPVPQWSGDDEIGTHSYSWGCTYSTSLYVENPLDAVALAVAWKDALHAELYAKFLAKKATI